MPKDFINYSITTESFKCLSLRHIGRLFDFHDRNTTIEVLITRQ